MSFVALSPQAHSGLAFKPVSNFSFSANTPLIPVFLPELTPLLQSHTLCFGKQGNHYSLFALVGSAQKGSAYVTADGRWMAPYIPASLRKGPFALLKAQEREDLIFCIAEEGFTQEPDAEPLFTAEGEMTAATKTHFDIVKLVHGANQATHNAVASLAKAGVIKPWDLVINDGQQLSKTSGLYCIDEKALNALSAEDYYSLKGAPMIVAYSQLFSMRNKALLEALIAQQAKLQTENLDVEAFFGGADDTLKFDL